MSASLPVSRFLTHRSLAGGIVLGALAWALLALQIARVLGAPRNPFSVLVATAVPVVLSATLFIGAIGVYYYELDDLALRISAWTVLGVVLFSAVIGVEVAYLQSRFTSGIPLSILLANVAAGGAVLGFLIGLYDARQRRLRQDLREEYDRTVGLSQRLSVLARIIRHDLRNHLNVIVGQATRVQERTTSEEASEAATEIREAGEELLAISDNIRQFSTILADPRPEQTPRRMDLTEVVTDAIATVRARHDAEHVGIDVTAPEAAIVRASPFLSQAVIELLENAIVHNDADEPRIDVTISEPADPEDGVELRIADNGPGIPEAEMTVHNRESETQLDHSTGVGLWLVRWVVDASGGDLAFETGESGGTTVRIQLPNPASSKRT